jgi:hypothetical protein
MSQDVQTEDVRTEDPRAAAIKADLEALEHEAERETRRLLGKILAGAAFVGAILLISWLLGRSSRDD